MSDGKWRKIKTSPKVGGFHRTLAARISALGALLVGGLFLRALRDVFVAASEPTPMPPSFPPQIPLEQVSHLGTRL
jgi:hypothetical protein